MTGVSADGYSGGSEYPGTASETDNCTGGVSGCNVSVTFATSGTFAFPQIEVDVSYQYGEGYTLSGGGPAMYPALATSKFLMPTGNVTHMGSIAISSVTIDPKSPSSTDPKITGTITVRNTGSDPVTALGATVSSNTPKIVTVSSPPKPASFASLAGGATTNFTFALKPQKGGDASIQIGASGKDGGTTVSATPRTRKFTVDGGITVKLTVDKSPDSHGKAVLRARVANPSLDAVSGIQLAVVDTTGGRKPADIGKPDPKSFALGGHDSRAVTVDVVLPERGRYLFSATATGRSHGENVEGRDKLAVTRKGAAITVDVTPVFKPGQIGHKGHLNVKIVNHLNENLTNVATTVTVPSAKDDGRATIGTLPGPLSSVAGTATVTVPATLTYPGKVPFRVRVTGRGEKSGDPVSEVVTADTTVKKPEFTVKATTDKRFADQALAEDFAGNDWSTEGGPIDVRLEGQEVHTYSQRDSFHGTMGLPLWPNHAEGGQNKPLADAPCWATFSAQQGDYRKKVKVEGKGDRLLLFADGDPLLKSRMELCENEINYVKTTPGTAMYFTGPHSGGPGPHITLTVVQAGHVLAHVDANDRLNVCVDLTDGVRDVRVKADGPKLSFAVSHAHCKS